MSLKSKIEAVIYASEEPVTLQQLVGLLAVEAQGELDVIAADQAELPLDGLPGHAFGEMDRDALEAGTDGRDALDDAVAEALEQGAATSRQDADGHETGDDVPSESEPDGTTVLADAAQEAVAPVAVVEIEPETGAAVRNPEDDDARVEADAARPEEDKRLLRERERGVRDHIRRTVEGLMRDYAESDRGIEIREVASGFRMGTKPEYHDAVRGFVKGLKPALKLTLPALETLAVVAYKQPVTAAEISEIRGVDSAGVLGGLMARKLIATAGRKQVIGRPMLYKTTRDFLLRFGLKDVNELPSMEEFERMAGELAEQEDLPMDHADSIIEQANARGDAEHIREDEEASQHGSEPAAAMEDAESADSDMDNVNEAATAAIAAGGHDEEGIEDRTEDPGDEGNDRAEGSGDAELVAEGAASEK